MIQTTKLTKEVFVPFVKVFFVSFMVNTPNKRLTVVKSPHVHTRSSMEHLWSPWRMKYIRQGATTPAVPSGNVSATRPLSGPMRETLPPEPPTCIFCEKPREDRDETNLIVHRGEHAFVILNLYPYNNGHFMVVPYQHVSSLENLDTATLTELMVFSQQGLKVLRAVYNPHAFNLGVNIGTAAGAGIADHVHMHVVPRWPGDTNYMTTVSGVRVIPEDLRETYRLVKNAWPR